MIYVTPFNNKTKQCTGPSTESGFDTIDEVVDTMTDFVHRRGDKTVIYGDSVDRVIFSTFIFSIDETINNG